MVGNLQQVRELNPSKWKFEISSEKRCLVPGPKQENDRVIVLRGSSDTPARGRVQYGEGPELLTGGDKSQAYISTLSEFDKRTVRGDHRVAPEPEFAWD